MKTIHINVDEAQHQQLKALAALQGKSIKDFVLERTLGSGDLTPDEAAALVELEELLDRRLRRAQSEGVSTTTVGEIFEQVIAEADRKPRD